MLPRLPLLFKISCLENKGRQTLYLTLRSTEVNKCNLNQKSIDKWHELVFKRSIWDDIWSLPKKYVIGNRMKWVSIQINQQILPTNYTVSQYNRNVDPGCSLCNRSHPEKLNLLLWGCPMVQHFWSMIGNLITEYYPNFQVGLKEAIFGDIKSEGNSVPNSLLVPARQFI